MTIGVDVRLNHEVATAAAYQARKSGLTRHAWILATLDSAAGLTAPEDAREPLLRRKVGGTSTRLKLQLVTARYHDYDIAAERANMPLAQWIATIIGIATGLSELPDQIARIR